MSVKRIIVVGISVIALAGFITLGISDAVKRNDQLKFQEVELKSKSIEIQQLNTKYDKLNDDLKKAQEDKNASQEEIDKLKKQEAEYEKEKQRLQAELQAKIENKNKLASASTQVVNAATNTQTASAASYSGGSLESIVKNAAIKNGLDPNWFWNLAKCESTWNPNAVNTSYYENGHPSGLFQHISGYWPERAAKHGYAGASVFNAEANANVTAAMWKSGSHLWECQ